MGEKQRLIAKMIGMQKAFIEKQRKSGVSAQEYFLPEEDDALRGYHEEFEQLAARLVDLAHREHGTSR